MGARDLLRDFFMSNLGKVLGSDELREASGGISEWARRVRELRNEGASNITPDRPSAMKLKAQIRKARGEDQIELLKFLIDKFPNQTRDLLD